MDLTTPANDSGETAHEELVPGFSAEEDREWAVAFDPDVQRGWAFGVEGPGHPERLVGAHVAAMLRNIGPDDELRPALRFLALVHDSMKWAVRRDAPWSPDNDHAVLARRVAERHTGDPRLLQTIELHDDAYCLFRNKPTEPGALDALLARAAMPIDIALLRGRTFAQRVVEEMDQTGARILEARALEPVGRRP
jgi:hypothetical protein